MVPWEASGKCELLPPPRLRDIKDVRELTALLLDQALKASLFAEPFARPAAAGDGKH